MSGPFSLLAGKPSRAKLRLQGDRLRYHCRWHPGSRTAPAWGV